MKIIDFLEDNLVSSANAENAKAMSKYMRNLFPFYGVKSPERKLIVKKAYQCFPVDTTKKLVELVNTCWEKDEREWQYAAIDLMTRYLKLIGPDEIENVAHWIKNKSWWDTVDFLSPTMIGKANMFNIGLINKVSRRFVDDDYMWLRRSAILMQLKLKGQTDFDLQKSIIHKCIDEKEFFIQKAIGWSLREYSKTDPKRVCDFIKNNELSSLASREGMKWLNR